MTALTAVRWEPDSQPRYRCLTARGRLHKVAMVAVMGRLACLLNTLLREDRLWQAEPPCTAVQDAASDHRPRALELERNSPFGWSCAKIAFPRPSCVLKTKGDGKRIRQERSQTLSNSGKSGLHKRTRSDPSREPC